MSEKDIQKLVSLANKKMTEPRSKAQALAALVSAGIITKNGNYTKPYKHISLLVKK